MIKIMGLVLYLGLLLGLPAFFCAPKQTFKNATEYIRRIIPPRR